MMLAVFTGVAFASQHARDDAQPECNTTDIYESLDAAGVADFNNGRIRTNLTCNIGHNKCNAYEFCYYRPDLGAEHASSGTPFCVVQDGFNDLDPSGGVPSDLAAEYTSASDQHNFRCVCFDATSGQEDTAYGLKGYCLDGHASYDLCGNQDGTTSNKAQLTDETWGIQGQNTIYWNRNQSALFQETPKCQCGVTINSPSHYDFKHCELAASSGEYCHEPSQTCSEYPQCAQDTILKETCQCGDDVCRFHPATGTQYCRFRDDFATEWTPADEAVEWFCDGQDVYRNVAAATIMAIAIPTTIMVWLILRCLYFTWWYKSINNKLA